MKILPLIALMAIGPGWQLAAATGDTSDTVILKVNELGGSLKGRAVKQPARKENVLGPLYTPIVCLVFFSKALLRCKIV